MKRIFSRFTTTFADTEGVKHQIDVSIASQINESTLNIAIQTETPNITIGIAKLSELLGEDGFNIAEKKFRTDGFEVREQPSYEILGTDRANQLLGGPNIKAPVLLLRGRKDGAVEVPLLSGVQPVREPSIMVIIDKDGKAIIANTIFLYRLTAKSQ